jgi:branched-chain amino acid transport system ATP-binding protein
MTPLLTVENLCAYYGPAQALFNVGFSVQPGEVLALMGRNGAGKSTTLKSIMGLLPRTTGTIQFENRCLLDVDTRLAPHQIAQAGIGWVPEDRRIFTELTVLENCKIGIKPARHGTHAGAAVWTLEKIFALFPNLKKMQHRLGSEMSGGEQQMLTIARTLMGNPRVLLLDEPSEGVAPIIVQQLANAIRQLKQEGLSVVLSEQNLHFAKQVSDTALVLENGQVRFYGSMAELESNADLRKQYLAL